MKTTIVALTLCLASLFAFGSDPVKAGSEKEKDPIVGHWRWRNHTDINEIRPDGTIQSPRATGVWKGVPADTAERKYEISWKGGATVDKLTLSEDGKKLTVKNNRGEKFTAEKID
ncbi:hypothetical protein CfE428DRAFT_2145 [Chthoniobacter flavus Ellin428]|uniref:Uncharacterized protein n=1 Tax=Chthoniobacter flavus Ellin428 TaxID=497964 RepID=B4CZQ7_9BACT|nr:hypothetical protein [Chthoniobacter flavus]EDY20221.1 hypothetical protein CfE428DRAFT_2145 [Chthoniobacter flavus Ellin428]TCO94117.1 hypothetical protein EV701_103205 [Chthoniobacter flavus]